MIKIPFCYEIIDKNNEKVFVKLVLEFSKKITEECYSKIHLGAVKDNLIGAIPISIDKYIKNKECSTEEIKLLKKDFLIH